jgi:hypothetical protein
MRTSVSFHPRHRFAAEIISHCVWLYFCFALSFRDVEEMLAMRGVCTSYKTVREWCLLTGQTYANDLRRRSPRPGDRWHLDQVFLKINGRLHLLTACRWIRMAPYWTSPNFQLSGFETEIIPEPERFFSSSSVECLVGRLSCNYK